MKNVAYLLRRLLTVAAYGEKARGVRAAGILLTIAAIPAIVSLRLYANSAPPEGDARPAEKSVSQRDEVDTVNRALRRCIQLAENGKIDNATVHYRTWNSYSSVPVSEDDLMAHPSDCDLVLRGSVMQEPARMLAKYLQHYQLKACEVSPYYVHFALGVVYRCGDEEVLRICVSKDPPVVSINGEFFRVLPSALYPLTMMLPPTVRDDMFMNIALQWVSVPRENLHGGERVRPDSLPSFIEAMKTSGERSAERCEAID